ncbi:MAG: exported protein of unknown function, partial [Friedmanniella sp.]|nr:exported protein of unknown function [Friedmanniella sp.]
HRVLMAEAGPDQHRPAHVKDVVQDLRRGTVTTFAYGAPLLDDLETAPRHRTYALSQGRWDYPDRPENAGLPASPNTGSLTRVPRHGGQLQTVVSGLDRPTSMEFLGDSAYVVTLTGTVLRIAHVSGHH